MRAEGDSKANAKEKRGNSKDNRREEFDKAFDILAFEEDVKVNDLAEYLEVSDRTIRSRVNEFKEEYELKNGVITRKK